MHKQKFLRQQIILGLVLILEACGETDCNTIKSEEGQLAFSNEFIVRMYENFQSGGLVVEGARYCPQFVGWYDDEDGFHGLDLSDDSTQDDSSLRSCFATSLTGPAMLDGDRCIQFGQGEEQIVWDLVPQACELNQENAIFIADRLRFSQISRERVEAYFDLNWRERLVEKWSVAGPANEFPKTWYYPQEQVIQVIAGQTFAFPVALREYSSDAVVAWTREQGVLQVKDTQGRSIEFDAELAPALLASQIGEEDVVVHMQIADRLVPVGNLTGVPETAIHALEIVAMYSPSEAMSGRSWDLPWAVRAVAHDSQGQLLHAVPVTWKVITGRLAVEPGSLANAALTPDYAFLSDECEPPPDQSTSHHATIEATVGQVRATLDLKWTAQARQISSSENSQEEEFTPSKFCQGPGEEEGCQCSVTHSQPPVIMILIMSLFGMQMAHRRLQKKS